MAAIETSLPLVRPMLATLGELPTAPGWGFEFKWDGVRALSYVEAGRLQILSRNDRDVTAGYPELAAVADRLPGRRAVLDGEIVALDADGRPSFSLLQQRMHVRAPAAALLSRVPIRLYLFDVLHLTTTRPSTCRTPSGGRCSTAWPWTTRWSPRRRGGPARTAPTSWKPPPSRAWRA